MPDSFVSSPGRYLVEMLARAGQQLSSVQRVLVFNPRFRLTEFSVRACLAHAKEYSGNAAILSARRDVPMAYLLDATHTRCRRLLLLLSCSSTSIDQAFLAAALFTSVDQLELGLPLLDSMTDGFLPAAYRRPMEWCARHATKVLQTSCGTADTPLAERAAARDALLIKAFFTHHAGDVLFMAIASRDAGSPYYDEIIVHDNYLPIARRFNGETAFSSIRCPVPFRGDYHKEDCEHFMDVAKTLPGTALYAYCRTTRNYNFTDFHYIDHFRFCLGIMPSGVVHAAAAVRAVKQKPSPSLSALLHFDAGWPLKIYPSADQKELVALLLGLGFRVTTLDAKIPITGAESVRFNTLDAFDDLLASFDVLVGMDSFPAHYAALTRKCRTVHLFSSTHPVHSACNIGANHISLQRGEVCCPCLGWDKCIRYGGTNCHNFSSPETIVASIQQMLTGESSVRDQALPPPPSSKCPRHFNTPQLSASPIPIRPMSLGTVRILSPWQWILALPRLALMLGREFFITLRRDGIRKASYLSFAFLRRHLAMSRRTWSNGD